MSVNGRKHVKTEDTLHFVAICEKEKENKTKQIETTDTLQCLLPIFVPSIPVIIAFQYLSSILR